MIDFRIWDSKKEGFFYGEIHNEESTTDIKCFLFTGLLDIHGNKIYEGQRVRYVEKLHEHGDTQELIAQVVYDKSVAAFGLASLKDEGEIWNYFTDYGIYALEII